MRNPLTNSRALFSDNYAQKTMLYFFFTYFYKLGLNTIHHRGGVIDMLKAILNLIKGEIRVGFLLQ
jgi:hypothetical protein